MSSGPGPSRRSPPIAWRRGWSSALPVFCAGLCIAANHLGAFDKLELGSLDWRLRCRNQFRRILAGGAEPSRDIALIEIGDESLRRIKEPLILWDPHFAKVVSALAASSAKVIVMDVVWLKSIEDYVMLQGAGLRKPLVKALLAASRDNRLVLASLAKTRPDDEEGSASSTTPAVSLGKYAALIGFQHFGIVNPLLDPDKVVRRQRAFYRASDGAGGTLQTPSLTFLAVSRFRAGTAPSAEPQLIDYDAGRVSFPKHPFHEVLAKSAAGDKEYFERNFSGHMVFVGTTSGLLDRHATPIGNEIPGLRIHAFGAQTFLRNRPFLVLGRGAAALVILALSLAAGLPALRLSPLASGLGAIALGLAYLLSCLAAFHRQAVLPLAAPLCSLPLTYGLVYVYRYMVTDREKRRVSEIFKHYVNDKIVNLLLDAPDRDLLEGKSCRICVLFCDIRGFTRLSEEFPPRDILRFLNDYLSSMSEIILANDGTVDKFIGDGIMAYFGAPVADPQAALKAARAALAMQDKLRDINRRIEPWLGRPLKIGIGLHMGQAVVGNIGSRLKMDFTAIGDAVNLASRVEGLTKELDQGILLTEEVHAHVKESVETEALGERGVRGHSAVRLYALQGLKPSTEKR